MKINIILFLILNEIFCLTLFGQTKDSSFKEDAIKFTVSRVPEWDSIFVKNSGWIGADGIFSATVNGKKSFNASLYTKTIFWFSDTIFGDIINDSLQPGWMMINNTTSILKDGLPRKSSIKFQWKIRSNQPQSTFVPEIKSYGKDVYYWLGDGFVNPKNHRLYIFAYGIRNLPLQKNLGFKVVSNSLIVNDISSDRTFLKNVQFDLPFFKPTDKGILGSFGAGVFVNTKEAEAPMPDGFIYIYGIRGDDKDVIVARVLMNEIENFSKWTFWNGRSWDNNFNEISNIATQCSNEMSVTPLGDGRYAMIFQIGGMSNYIGMRIGKTPYGPFGPIIQLYDVSNDIEKSNKIFCYNAKAHPTISEKGELIISYNVNAFDFENEVKKFPNLYRPRFIKLKYEIN